MPACLSPLAPSSFMQSQDAASHNEALRLRVRIECPPPFDALDFRAVFGSSRSAGPGPASAQLLPSGDGASRTMVAYR
jgi:hypothetical protein